MFQYEYEKRPPSSNSCDSRATVTTDWSRVYPGAPGYQGTRTVCPSVEKARRPLPPRPIVCERIPTKTTVPLKVWIIASASCFAVCAALVLATVLVTRWGAGDVYTRQLYDEHAEPIYSNPYPPAKITKQPSTTESDVTSSDELENEIQLPILEKLSIFKNMVANRDKNRKIDGMTMDLSLVSKPQLHPIHDTSLHHEERRIEKKDQARYPQVEKISQKLMEVKLEQSKANINHFDGQGTEASEVKEIADNGIRRNDVGIPEFKPTLPDVFYNREIKLSDGYVSELKQDDYEEYYNDENLYDDYMQSNTMTSYLIEKVQELHDWITSDPDFQANSTKKQRSGNEFGQLLKALNDSLIEGNVTIVMNKLKDIYFGDNYTLSNHTRKVILSNSTDLLSFGILTLDVMLLHNIQLMAWENQEAARIKMMKDPEVFAFNALFLEPSKVEAKQNELLHYDHAAFFAKRQSLRQESADEFDIGKNLLENILEVGMSTARAAIHLGRAYKNTKIVLNQLSNRESLNANIQTQLSRNIDANTHALNRLQTSFNKDDSAATTTDGSYTELDCVWLLYCKNLVVTAKLNPPYGTMARINGLALRMLTGELAADKALDTMIYEALTGWTELKCMDMFPRCSKVNAASIVMESIMQPLRKSQSANRTR